MKKGARSRLKVEVFRARERDENGKNSSSCSFSLLFPVASFLFFEVLYPEL